MGSGSRRVIGFSEVARIRGESNTRLTTALIRAPTEYAGLRGDDIARILDLEIPHLLLVCLLRRGIHPPQHRPLRLTSHLRGCIGAIPFDGRLQGSKPHTSAGADPVILIRPQVILRAEYYGDSLSLSDTPSSSRRHGQAQSGRHLEQPAVSRNPGGTVSVRRLSRKQVVTFAQSRRYEENYSLVIGPFSLGKWCPVGEQHGLPHRR